MASTNPTGLATKRQEALNLADELLADIELRRIAAADIARKAGRLARLLDDAVSMDWLRHEAGGYPTPLDSAAVGAATRSGRQANEGNFWTVGLGTIEMEIDSYARQMEGLNGPLPDGDWAYRISLDRASQLGGLVEALRSRRALLDRILGAIHEYAAERYQELRFGAAVETAFSVVRAEVDGQIADLVPGALPMITAAFENAGSGLPEHWANAASTCRRLLKHAADELRPAGPDTRLPGGKKIRMGDGNYVNRLVDWISAAAESDTEAAMIIADLEYLGHRIDAADAGGQKGAHDQVTQVQASRYIAGTYLLLGDILRMREGKRGSAARPSVDPPSPTV
jgi:hypothetical protein